MTNEAPKFPVLIHVGRAGASGGEQWETVDATNADKRIAQMEADPTIQWFYAYEVGPTRTIAIKKTIVHIERPEFR